MKLSAKSLNTVTRFLIGDGWPEDGERLSPRRTLTGITEFFHDFGERDLHPASGAPSRYNYALEKLRKFNGTQTMQDIVVRMLEDLWSEQDIDKEHAGAYLNDFLRRDGYEITIEKRYIRMVGDRADTEPYFSIRPLGAATLPTPALLALTEASLAEHVAKARQKIDAGDHAGAITSAYTLVESFLKVLLRRLGVTFNEDEGDIRKLYALVAEPMNLSPSGTTLESYLKTILQGLKHQVSGLYELANKASDRHDRRYDPGRRHAKLAVNAAFVLCEFLLDSFEAQQARKARPGT